MPRSRLLVSTLGLLAAAVLANVAVTATEAGTATAGAPTSTATTVAPTTTTTVVAQQTAATFTGVPTVGALFDAAGRHFCTASVVDSPAGDVLVTAAHCITGTGSGLRFEPGYHDGVAPYGTWTVTAAYAAPTWLASQAAGDDVAFLTVADQQWEGALRSVQSVVGADQLAGAPTAGTSVDVVAYNDAAAEPVACTAAVTLTAGSPTFACADYVDGSSGSPWLVSTASGTEVDGVIGGLHQGGCEPDVSYSPAFGSATVATYERAVAGGTGDTLPAPGSDGCTTGL